MAVVVEHLSVAELEHRYKACEDVTSSRHFQTIYLLAKGHSTREVTEITSFGLRWVEQLLERRHRPRSPWRPAARQRRQAVGAEARITEAAWRAPP